MRRMFGAALALACLSLAASAPAQGQPADPPAADPKAAAAAEQARARELKAILDSLRPVSGDVALPQASAVLHLGKDYYYLPPEDARRVIVDGWGNPPQMGEGVLGMVFPAGKTFLDDVWGAVITYEPTGYVSDEDAASADYDGMMKEMQAGTEAINAERTRAGYPAEHLVGWAQKPTYDPASHSVVWARNIAFDGQADNSLNYDVRLLGRHGVLSLNMVTAMSHLGDTRVAAAKFAKAAEFQAGARYADYRPGVDRKAEYGVAGLIAAGTGGAVAKKLGLLGILLAFGKKFLFLIVAALAGIGALARRFFNREEPEPAYAEADYAAYEEAPAHAGSAGAWDQAPAGAPPEPEAPDEGDGRTS